MNIHLYLVILLGLIFCENSLAQIPDLIKSTPPKFAQEDTTVREVERIKPWISYSKAGFNRVITDSLLRWEIWPNWGDYYAYRRDVIAYRQGTIGRLDVFDIDGYDPLEQKITLNGIPLNNPITGYVNYNHIPSNRVAFMDEFKGGNYTSDIRLRDFYLIKPLSYLNFDESGYNYRNLEFMVVQNFRERTNAELSFWDRRDGGNYPNNEVQGSQILLRGYHYLNQNLQIRGMLLRNQFEREEPFGYVINDPETFAFNEFTTQSNRTNSSSKNLRRDINIGIYAREDSVSKENWGLELHQSINELKLPFQLDTLHWDVRSQALKGFKMISHGKFLHKGSVMLNRFTAKKHVNFTKSKWTTIEAGLNSRFAMNKNTSFYYRSQHIYRTDARQGHIIDVGFQKFGKINYTINLGAFTHIPTIQHMYWKGKEFFGDEDLTNVYGFSISPQIKIQFNDFLTFGMSGRFKFINHDVALGTDSAYVNTNSYSVTSTTVFGKFENNWFNFESSGTMYTSSLQNASIENGSTTVSNQKIWLRNNAFFKGYLYKRATFVKMGVRTTFNVLPYRTKAFNSSLQFWESTAIDEFVIPSYFRLDAELSARLRSMMILIRWENVLEGFGQLGYFETATLPMPSRRLIVGIRAQFRN